MSALFSWAIGSTTGRIVIGVVVFMIWLSFHDRTVANRATATCNAQHQAETLKEIKRQKDAADALIKDADAGEADAVKAQKAAEAERDEANADMAKLKLGECVPVRDGTLKRLRNIK